MKVKVHLPQKIALKLGVARWGDIEVELQPILDELGEDERTQLLIDDGKLLKVCRFRDKFSDDWERITVATATGEDTVGVIRDCLADNEAKRQELVAQLDIILADVGRAINYDGSRRWQYGKDDIAALAHKAGIDPAPYENALQEAAAAREIEWRQEWAKFFETWEPGQPHTPSPEHKLGMASESKHLSLAHAQKVAEGFGFDDVLARIAARQEEIAAEKAAADQVKEQSRQVWVSWAVERGSENLRRAIAEGYPLGKAVEMEIVDSIFPGPGSCTIRVCRGVEDEQLRRVPGQAAYSLQAYLRDRLEGVEVPEGTEVEVGQIFSVTVYTDCNCDEDYPCGDCDQDHEVKVKRTAVPVYVLSPHYSAEQWYVLDE